MQINIEALIKQALSEDIGEGDHTSLACIDPQTKSQAKLLVKETGILSGVEIALLIFNIVDSNLKVNQMIASGAPITKGDIVLTVEGSAQSILKAERLVLNMMQRMSGIASITARYCSLIAHTNCKLLDTRKTTPNFRYFEKLAVVHGGGHNHRFGLYDMIMIKDNHIDYAGGIHNALKKTFDYIANKQLSLQVEIETRNLDELKQVLESGFSVNRIMLDNYTPAQLKEAIQLIAGVCETEASGGIDESSIAAYAETGVDFISTGALTHSYKSLDLSLKAY